MKNIAINGLGRIGKLVVRRLFDVGLGTTLTQLNDLNSDCTGSIKNSQDANTYFESGIPQVLVSAPVNDEKARNIVFGVNHEIYNGPENLVFTAASCTTNCIAPL